MTAEERFRILDARDQYIRLLMYATKINTDNMTNGLHSLYIYHYLDLEGMRCPNEAELWAYVVLLTLNDGRFM